MPRLRGARGLGAVTVVCVNLRDVGRVGRGACMGVGGGCAASRAAVVGSDLGPSRGEAIGAKRG